MRQRIAAAGLNDIADKLDAGVRLDLADGVRLFGAPDLLTVGPHETNLWRPDPVIDPRILRDPASPLSKNKHRSSRCADTRGSALLASQYRCRPPRVSTTPHQSASSGRP